MNTVSPDERHWFDDDKSGEYKCRICGKSELDNIHAMGKTNKRRMFDEWEEYQEQLRKS